MTDTQPQDRLGEVTDMMIALITIVVAEIDIMTTGRGERTITTAEVRGMKVRGTRTTADTLKLLSREGVTGRRKSLTNIARLIKNVVMMVRLIRNVLKMIAAPQTRSAVMKTTTAPLTRNVLTTNLEVTKIASVHLTTLLNV
jgi:hypothetical protein